MRGDLTEERGAGAALVYKASDLMGAQAVGARVGSGRVARRRAVGEALVAYLWIAPAVIVIGLFHFLPVLYAVYISLHRWGLREGPFVGLDNYQRALNDGEVWNAFLV